MTSNASDSDLILYQTKDGLTKVEVRLLDETVWLNQAQRYLIFMLPALITIQAQTYLKSFLLLCKTKCIGLLTDILQLKLSIIERILQSQIWGLPLGLATVYVLQMLELQKIT